MGGQWFFEKWPRGQNKFVDITDYIDKKIEALCLHESQMVLTVRDMQYSLEASGLDVPWLANLDPHDFRDAIDRRIRAVTRAAGRPPGFEYAEGFRRTGFAAMQRLAEGQELAEDV